MEKLFAGSIVLVAVLALRYLFFVLVAWAIVGLVRALGFYDFQGSLWLLGGLLWAVSMLFSRGGK